MKVNVPEKLYCTPTKGGFYLTTTKPEPPFAEGVEYIRTDAFIEKACKWLRNYLEITGKELLIEDFKIAMEE